MRRIDKLGKRAAALALAVSMSMSVMPSVLAVDAEDVTPAAAQTETQPEEEEPADSVEEPAEDETEEVVNPIVIPGPDGLDSAVDVDIDDAELMAARKHKHSFSSDPNSNKIKWWDKKSTCTEKGRAMIKCNGCFVAEYHTMDPYGHSYGEWKIVDATCTEAGRKYHVCSRCGDVQDEEGYSAAHPATDHSYGEWIYVAATCTKGAQKYKVCQNEANGKVCGDIVPDDVYEADPANGPLEHILAHKDKWEYPCVNGTRTYYCTREGCTETDGIPEPETLEPTKEHVPSDWILDAAPTCTTNGQRHKECTVCHTVLETDTTSKEMKKLGHDWGKYIDDDKPGCQQQTATAKCKREGCNATDPQNWKNFGSDGNPLPHKYTHYTNYGTYQKATCDYCGKVDEIYIYKNPGDYTDVGLADVAGSKTQKTVKNIINDTLKQTQAKVNQAETKEDATKALKNFKDDAVAALVKNIKFKVGDAEIGITPEQAADIVNGAIPSLDDLEKSLNDSFLSKDSIQATVNTLVNSVTSDAGSQATEDAAFEIIRNVAYDYLKNTKTSNDPAVKGLVTKLVTITADGSQEDWDALTDAIVDDAVKLAIEELRKDDDYAKLLNTKLGAETLDELEAMIKDQLVNDPTFMNSVRSQIKTAGANATNGVTHGWSDDKVLAGLRRDLLPVSDLVENKIKELGDGAADIADKKVDDTVHKVLPGKLGDWVSGKLSNKATDAVKSKVDEVNKKATNTITGYIKKLTCGSQHGKKTYTETYAPTCTHGGEDVVRCSNCDWILETRPLDPLQHTPVVDAAVEPTETSTGLTEGSHCSVCGAVLQAQEIIPMLDPSIDTWFSRAATTEADAKAAGFDSVEAVNAALDAALTAAGFDPANAEHFTIQVNSSIGVLPNDRFPDDGVTGKLTLPEGTRGKTAQIYYAVQVFTADTRFHKAGDVVVTPLRMDNYAKTGLQFTVYSEAVMAIAWKAQ